MTHLRHLREAEIAGETALTIGVFDGVHRGHQALIRGLVERARERRLQAVVLTFFPHPDHVIHGQRQRHYLTTPDQRAQLLFDLGVDLVITHPFDERTRRLSAAAFVDGLAPQLHLRELWVGADFALGYQREGSLPVLRERGAALGFRVNAFQLLSGDGDAEAISSSQVRESLRKGDVAEANALLGRDFSLPGVVIPGQRRGRTIGVPTANLGAWDEQVIPAAGVYAGWAKLAERRCMAATNIGMRPTFGEERLSIEAHLLDFEGDIYGKELELSFQARLRPEQKFAGLDELVAQIHRDIAATRRLLGGQRP